MLSLRDKLLNIDDIIDNEYLYQYVCLVQERANPIHDSSLMQKHHIIPRSYFEKADQPVDDSSDNIVSLFYADHILAHYYLSLCTTGCLGKAMKNAFLMLVNFSETFEVTQLPEYQKLYEEWYQSRLGVSPGNKGKPMSEEQKRKISNSLKGHAVSNETRERMRQAQLNMSPEKRQNIIIANKNKNYRPTEETRAKQSAALKGHFMSLEARAKIGSANSQKLRGGRWFNDGVKNIYVRPGESVNQGWISGKIKTCKRWYNNGLCELKSEICPEGFILGRLPYEIRMKNK